MSEKPLVMVDAGHSASDPGAIALDRTKESDYNYDLAVRLKHHLNLLGFDAHITRTKTEKIGLKDRVGRAIAKKAEVFVSIHNNSASDESANGFEILYNPRGKYRNDKLAEAILDTVMQTGEYKEVRNRGLKQRTDLAVLNHSKNHMPACLVEVAFLSNTGDLERLKDKHFREATATAIAEGVAKFHEQYVRK